MLTLYWIAFGPTCHENLSGTIWTVTVENSNNWHIVPERLAERVWWRQLVPVLSLRYGPNTFTLRQSGRSLTGIFDFKFGRSFALLQKSRHLNFSVWTKALPCMVFALVQPARVINYYPVCTVIIALCSVCNSMRAMSFHNLWYTTAENCLLSDIIERWLSTWFPEGLGNQLSTARIKQKCAFYWQFWF